MKKLKGIDFKALFIDHGEKMALGVIALVVLVVLTTSTAWSRCQQTPDELKAKIDQASASIDAPTNTWPKAKQDQFVVVDFTDKARDIFKGLDVARYEFSTPVYWPLYRKKEKAKEPEFMAPQYLLATPGHAILGISTAPAFDALAQSGEMDKAADSALPSDFKDPNAGPGARGAGPASGPMAGHAAGGGAMAHSGGGGAGAGHAGAGPRGRASTAAAPSMGHEGAGTMGSMSGGAGTSGMTARGVRYVAVRAIVPIKEQIEKMMRALNLSSYADASAAVEYTDFVLERQAAIPGPDPWAGKWEVVDIKTAVETLTECADFDPDPVPADLQDSVITMALPYRLLKYWGDDATHPNIKNFQLSKEEMEREMKLQSKLLEEYEKLQLDSTPKVQKKGLSAAQNDMRGMGRQLINSQQGSGAMKDIMNTMMEGGVRGMGVPDIQARLTASGRLYLFRYFDFDVQPGMAYRYKVKLQLRNPNFERPYEEVENPDFTRDPYRETPWSNISSVAVVPESVHYFLKDVERDPSVEEKGKRPVANIDFFEWDPKIGTMLADTLRILSVGQYIADPKKKTLVLDPATPSFEEKDVALMTEDVLLDASGDIDLSPADHPDLALKPEKGRKDVRIGMLAKALVVDSVGQLKELDPVSQAKTEQSLKQGVSDERKAYQYLRDAPKESSSSLDSSNAYRQMMTGSSNSPSGGHSAGDAKPTTKNAKKKTAGAGSMSSMPGGPMAPGGPGGNRRPPPRSAPRGS